MTTINLDRLYRIGLENAIAVKEYKKRFIYDKLYTLTNQKSNEKPPIILISGLQGIGKTTLMLQLFNQIENSFYFSADSILVRASTIYDVVENAYRNGYTTIFIDEIHKYPNWIIELKNVYDSFNISVIASGSSTAALKKGSLKLGRRALNIPLSPLTFSEYVYLQTGEKYVANLNDVLDKKSSIRWLANHPSVEKYYKMYLETGGFPIKQITRNTLFSSIKKMIYEDALSEFNLTKYKVDVCEKLLAFLSSSEPGEFSYTSFSSISDYSKSTVYESVNMLKELELISIIEQRSANSKAKSIVKLLFSHPNLRAAFANQLMIEPSIGALREEYFVFHMKSLDLPIFVPKKMRKNPDYEVLLNDKYKVLEIGGKNKGKSQLMGREGYILDDINLIVLGFVQEIDQK